MLASVPDRIDYVLRRVAQGDKDISPAVLVMAFYAKSLFLARSVGLIGAALMQIVNKGTGAQGGRKKKVRELYFDDVFQHMLVQVPMMAGMVVPYALEHTTFLDPCSAMQPKAVDVDVDGEEEEEMPANTIFGI
jgi:hypothetical protein